MWEGKEISPDDATSYLRHTDGSVDPGYRYDLFTMGATGVSVGVINKVTFYLRTTTDGGNNVGSSMPVMHLTLTSCGTAKNTTYSNRVFTTQSWEKTTNPVTSAAWVWSDFTDYYFGIALHQPTSNGRKNYPWCTQFYMVITYEAPSLYTELSGVTCSGVTIQ